MLTLFCAFGGKVMEATVNYVSAEVAEKTRPTRPDNLEDTIEPLVFFRVSQREKKTLNLGDGGGRVSSKKSWADPSDRGREGRESGQIELHVLPHPPTPRIVIDSG